MSDPNAQYGFNSKIFPCATELAISLLSGRWKMTIIWKLRDGKKRYGELKSSIPGITHKMLAQQLRELEEIGILQRYVYPVVPPKVEYELTALGHGLTPILEQLDQWGEHFRLPERESLLSNR
ncbi:winged helix-turn-helix transcriptional regulator [Paenibacillus methanolicus]|uniref:DNA-binding HxlR family transcriptional regulator n=1 Tax=Paenibacillus methanolicus TaxID=582686 RepID=A0A5S5C869_9BACL|nr:helix-turn-helix domain-containing protein [Paenibacillus methanolicus]TYP74798.1 DNA-binding HxlR family transcriptional regulator [Paenibacillus methanolicus]